MPPVLLFEEPVEAFLEATGFGELGHDEALPTIPSSCPVRDEHRGGAGEDVEEGSMARASEAALILRLS